MRRSYKQNCALAHGLDIIGERWTLLLVRELMIAPRRYSELLANLDGIGTNLLATRLKEMELFGLVRKADGRYTLTALGQRLAPVVWEIVRFGLLFGIEDDEARLTRPEWDVVALRALYDDDRGASLQGLYVIRLNGEPFCVERTGDTVAVHFGGCDDARADVALSKPTARMLAAGDLNLADAIADGSVTVTGGRDDAKQLLGAFRILG